MTISSLILALFLTPPDSIRGPVLLDFHADWCGPCRQMRPIIQDVQRRGYPVRSIDVDDDPELASQYRIEALPTLVLLDANGKEVLRRQGPQSASDLMKWLDRVRKSAPSADSRAETPASPAPRFVSNRDEAEDGSSSSNSSGRAPNPKPWETVVRITVQDNGSLGFGSGTVIKSTPEETIILTCAHIFQMNGRRKQVPPAEFPLPVLVELFDGVLGGPGGQTVRPVGRPHPAEVIDYDFDRDVGLVRIRPGRVVPAARVVPPAPYWTPRKNMSMFTVGCSHGNDATAWNTVITEPTIRGLADRPSYEAIQCQFSPKQGRSGGGLFTDDGYVAGVCNFAFAPRLSQGLYASPRSIHRILERNGLQDVFLPAASSPGTAIADARRDRSDDTFVARGQSPEDQENASLGTLAVDPILVPPPEILGVEPPARSSSSSSSRRVASVSDRGTSSQSRRWTPRDAAETLEMPSPSPYSPAEPLEATDSQGISPPRGNHVDSLFPLPPDDRFERRKPSDPSTSTNRRWKPQPQSSPR